MMELEKQNTEEKIWAILKGYEDIYREVQPTLTFSTNADGFLMQKRLLEKLPHNVQIDLLSILKGTL